MVKGKLGFSMSRGPIIFAMLWLMTSFFCFFKLKSIGSLGVDMPLVRQLLDADERCRTVSIATVRDDKEQFVSLFCNS